RQQLRAASPVRVAGTSIQLAQSFAAAAEFQSALPRSTGAHQNPWKSSAPAVAAVILPGPSSAVAAASRFELEPQITQMNLCNLWMACYNLAPPMKRCPTCNRTYTDPALNFCLEDGTPLAADNVTAPDLNATVRYPAARDTGETPTTEIYRPQQPAVSPRPPTPPPAPPPQAPPQWTPQAVSPMPTMAPPRKKSNAIWWVLGAFAAV